MAASPHIRVSATYGAENPDADPGATEVVINLLVVGLSLAARMETVLRPFGVSLGSFNLLHIVAGADEPITPTEIARRSFSRVTTATVTGLLDTNERNGLLRRGRHPNDRRRVLVELTPAGRALLDAIAPAVAAAEKRWVGSLSDGRRRALLRGLGEVQAALSSDDAP
jgi:DNA-binding MarR family transcriptional regulator